MKRDNIDLSEFGLDEDLNFDLGSTPNAASANIPKGRDAILEVPKSVASGIYNSVAGEGKRRRLILSALPNDYTRGMEAYDVIEDSGRELIREARDDYDRTKRELRRTAKSALPLVKKYLPSSLAKRVESFANRVESRPTSSYDFRSGEIEAAKEEMDVQFDHQAGLSPEADDERRIERVEDELRSQIDLEVNNKIYNLLAGIGNDTSFMRATQASSVNYRKKMIELNYRQLFALTDLIDLTRQQMDRLLPATEAIVKNTALPDYAKETTAEVAVAQAKRRMLESLAPSNFLSGYTDKLVANLRRSSSSFFSGVSDAVGGANAAIEAYNDENEHLTDEERKAKSIRNTGKLAGSFIGEKFIRPGIQTLGKKAREKAGGKESAIDKFGRKFRYNMTTLPERLNDFAKDRDDENYTLQGRMRQLIRDVLPGYNENNANLETLNDEALSRPRPWSTKNDISLNEVIPNWLAKIHKAIGDINGRGVLETYDYNRRQFLKEDDVSENIRERIAPKETRQYLDDSYTNLIERMDPENKLSEKDREVLKKLLDSKLRNLSQFDVNKLTESDKEFRKVDQEHDSRDLRRFFAELSQDKDKAIKINNMVSSGISTARDSVDSNQSAVNELRAIYGDAALVKAGVFKERRGRLVFNQAYNTTYADESEFERNKVVEEVANAAAGVRTSGVEQTANRMGSGDSQTLRDNLGEIELSTNNDNNIIKIADYIERIYNHLTGTEQDITPENIHKAMADIPVDSNKQTDDADPFVQAARKNTTKVDEARDVYVEGEDLPRLFSRLLNLGKYFNRETGTPIYRPEDIDGTVVDENDRVIISKDEMANPSFKLVDEAGNVFNVNSIDKLKNAFKFTSIFKRTKKEKPGGLGTETDTDGDGIRDGSFRDIKAKRQAKREKDAEAKAKSKGKKETEKKDSQSGFFSTLAGMLSGFLTKGGDLLKTLLTTLVGGGIASKVIGGVSTAASVGGTLARGAGKIASPVLKAGGNYIKRSPARAVSNARMLTSVASGLGTAATWGGRIAMGALGVLSSPWAIGAAVAYGAWKAYKVLSSEPIFKLDELRFAQYGIQEFDSRDSDEVAKIRFMEDLLLKYTSYDGNGISRLSGLDDEATTKLYEGLDIDPSDEERVAQFRRWFTGRFIPVYLLWTTRVYQNAPESKMTDMSKVDPEVLKTILDQVKLRPDHPIFNVTEGVFDTSMWDSVKGLWGGNALLTGPEVQDVFNEVHQWVGEKLADKKRKDKKRKETPKGTEADARKAMYGGSPTNSESKFKYGNAALENAAKDKAAEETIDGPIVSKQKWYHMSMKDAVKNEDGTYTLGEKTFRSKNAMRHIKQTMLRNEKAKGITDGDKTEYEVTRIRVTREANKVNAVDASRLKIYGLTDMKVSKVSAIYKLEERFIKDVIISGPKATFTGDWSELMRLSMPDFGMMEDNKDDQASWLNWAKLRFAPVFLSHIALVKRQSGSANPLDVIVSTTNAVQMKDLIVQLAATKTKFQDTLVSVWTITFSPFKDSEVNQNPSSIEGNLKFLDDLIKEAKASEQTKETTKQRPVVKVPNNKPETKPQTNPTRESARSYADEFLKAGAAMEDQTVSGPAPELVIPKDIIPDGQTGDGDYNTIKLKSKKRADVADMLYQVSKLTGVDHNLLMTVAMAESSMNPFAGAATSSAKGLFQFINSTWREQLDKYGNKFGIPSNASPMDPVANALLGAMYVKDGGEVMEKVSGREFNATDAYLSHFMGPGGARQFLTAMKSAPDQPAAKLFPKPAAANRPIFYANGTARTVKEVYEFLNRKMMSNWSHVRDFSKGSATPPVSQDPADLANNARITDRPTMAANTGTTVNEQSAREAQIAKINKGAPTSIERERSISMPTPVPQAPEPEPEATRPTVPNRSELSAEAYVERRRAAEAKQQAKEVDGEVFLSGMSEIARAQMADSKKSRDILDKQLITLKDIERHMGFLNEKVALLLPDSQEAEQLLTEEKRQQNRASMEVPKVVHDANPITVSRQRTW